MSAFSKNKSTKRVGKAKLSIYYNIHISLSNISELTHQVISDFVLIAEKQELKLAI